MAPEPELWLITFTDLLMVLVAMFALIFSMNVINEASLRSLLARIPRVATATTAPKLVEDDWLRDAALDPASLATLHQITDGFTQLLGAPSVGGSAGPLKVYRGGMTVSFGSNAITAHLGAGSFAQDTSELTFQSEETIRVMARALRGTAFPIEIETYRRSAGATSPADRSWPLAEERSLAVLRQFLDTGVGPGTLFAAARVLNSERSAAGDDPEETVVRIRFPAPVQAQVNSVSSFVRKAPISTVP